jgi:hypothetical protein
MDRRVARDRATLSYLSAVCFVISRDRLFAGWP